jgi:hypothetical protein
MRLGGKFDEIATEAQWTPIVAPEWRQNAAGLDAQRCLRQYQPADCKGVTG